jgi:protein TonB
MKKERKDDSFIKQPYYKGGDKALNIFINENLKYPESSKANKIEGDVHIRFEINYKGDVVDAKIIGGLDEACNEEAIRVVKLLKYIVPKNPRHMKITFHKNIRIHYLLHQNKAIHSQIDDQPKIANQTNQIQYNLVLTSNKPSVKVEVPKQSITYQYVVKIG